MIFRMFHFIIIKWGAYYVLAGYGCFGEIAGEKDMVQFLKQNHG